MTLQNQLTPDAIAQREMLLHEVTKERKRNLQMTMHLRMPPMPEMLKMKTMPKPMLQLILKKLQLPKTPRMVPKTLKQDNVDADAVAELDVEPDAGVARHAATTSTTTTATTLTTTTAAIINTTPATITATTTVATRMCTTTTATTTATTTESTIATNTSHVVTLVAVDVDAAPAVVTEREREELLLRLNSGTHLDGILTGLVVVWRVNVMTLSLSGLMKRHCIDMNIPLI